MSECLKCLSKGGPPMKNPLIAERLKFYRKKNNLTVKQVSALLSEIQPVAPKTIYGWESGVSQTKGY